MGEAHFFTDADSFFFFSFRSKLMDLKIQKKREQNETAPLKNALKFWIATEKKIECGQSTKNFCRWRSEHSKEKKYLNLYLLTSFEGKWRIAGLSRKICLSFRKWNRRKWRKKKRKKVKMAKLMHCSNFFFSSEALMNSIIETETSTNLPEAWKAAWNAFTKQSWKKLHFSQNKATNWLRISSMSQLWTI